jgi:hypothetical protein
MENEIHNHGSYGKQGERTTGTTSSWVNHVICIMNRPLQGGKDDVTLGLFPSTGLPFW